jgi:hypothetical protein
MQQYCIFEGAVLFDTLRALKFSISKLASVSLEKISAAWMRYPCRIHFWNKASTPDTLRIFLCRLNNITDEQV